MANYNQNWNNQIGGNLWGFGQNPNQGIASASMNVPRHMRQYFAGTNAPVYPGSAYSPHRGFEEMQFDETVQAPEKTGILHNIKNWGSNILDNTIMGRIAGGFDATNPRAFNYNPALEGQINFLKDKGAYGTDQSGLNKITGGVLQGKNLQSMFGSNDLAQMYEKQIAKYQKVHDNMDDEAKKTRYYNKFIKPARIQQSQLLGDRQQVTGEGIDLTTIQDPGKGRAVTTGGAAVTTGGGGTFNPMFDVKGRGDRGGAAAPSWHGATAARGRANEQVAGPGFGQGAYWAKGGRVGYRNGEFVDEDINIRGPNFDFNENIEMAEGKSPFDLRIDELMDTGMSWQEAYEIAKEEFGQIAEGQEDSFSDQGLASLV